MCDEAAKMPSRSPSQVHDREQAPGVGGGILEVADVGERGEPLDRRERQIAALELRVGVEHDRTGDRLRDRREIGDHAVLGDREIGLEDREDPGAPHALELGRLAHRVPCRGRRHPGHHRHPAGCRRKRDLDDAALLRPAQIGELAGGPERREAVHPGCDEVLDQRRQHLVPDAAILADRRHQVGKDAVEVCGAHVCSCNRAISIRLPSGSRV